MVNTLYSLFNNGKVLLNRKWSEGLSKSTFSHAWCIFCFFWRVDIGYILWVQYLILWVSH